MHVFGERDRDRVSEPYTVLQTLFVFIQHQAARRVVGIAAEASSEDKCTLQGPGFKEPTAGRTHICKRKQN